MKRVLLKKFIYCYDYYKYTDKYFLDPRNISKIMLNRAIPGTAGKFIAFSINTGIHIQERLPMFTVNIKPKKGIARFPRRAEQQE